MMPRDPASCVLRPASCAMGAETNSSRGIEARVVQREAVMWIQCFVFQAPGVLHELGGELRDGLVRGPGRMAQRRGKEAV